MNTLDIQRKLRLIREVDTDVTRYSKIFNSVIMFLIGSVMGYITRWLYTNEQDDSNIQTTIMAVLSSILIWVVISLAISFFAASPQRAAINVFLFLGGMCLSHYIFCILHEMDNPMDYMKMWFILTLAATIIAPIFWFGKGVGPWSVVIDVIIITVMTLLCFSVGHWYIRPTSIINTILFVVSAVMLHRNIKWSAISLVLGIALAILI